ncbi:MAG: hypothetical protein M1828_007662 [Chrysothrix sp. TS-e1954]|nr:MAG: hypothetical protein M1828_007662 [Chrysothrix sp. TS-e1954]
MAKFYGMKGESLNYAIGIIAGLDFLLFGYDQGVMGGILTLPEFNAQFPAIDTVTNTGPGSAQRSLNQGISVASYNLGCFCGAIMTIFVGNPLGRKRTIFIGSAIMVVGAILQCTSYELPQFIVGRIITGIGNGMNTSTVPTWQSETSKSHRRGQLVMIEGALITCGIMISYWIDFALSFAPGAVTWRFPIAFQIVFALIICSTILGLPESPRWLILKGREDEALDVLCALNNAPPDDKYVQNEFLAIKDTVLEMSKGSFRDLFTMTEDRHLHRVVLAYVNQMFQQISGINLITYYAATIYKNSIHLSGLLSRLLAACNGTEYFMASWIAVFTVEKIGRRKLMLFGAAGMSLSMVVLAATTAYPNNTQAGIAAAVFLFVFNTFFAIGWLGMTWLYPAEIVPLRIRAPANAVATSANWIFNFMVVMITPVAFNNIKYQTYIIFAVINAFIFPVVYFFYPETAYRSLEEMDTIFQKTTSIFNAVKAARDEPRRYDKKGNMIIAYEETDAARRGSEIGGEQRRSSVQKISDTHEHDVEKL